MNDVVALIPARKGSQRLSKKNYLDFGGISILENTVIMCIKSGIFDAIYLSTDDEELMSVALKHDIDFILRDKELADSNATSDRVVFDFVKRVSCNKVVWVNTASPLQTVDDIKKQINKTKAILRQHKVEI